MYRFYLWDVVKYRYEKWGGAMETPTSLSANLDIAGSKANLDRACKQLLSEKMILAWIMKTCLAEYKDCTVQEIAERYIEGTPQVAETAVAPNQTNAPKIHGLNTEDTSLNEQTITYDIRFFAVAPVSGDLIRLIINIEAQNKYNPGYPLMKRVVYYLSRLISAQYTTEFNHSDYGNLKKVYSIWICMNPPAERQNTITQYSIAEKNLIGCVKEPVQNYDLMTAIILCLGGKDNHNSEILRLLNVLLSKEESPSEKRRILHDDFDIPMTETLEEGVHLMCNYSDYIEDRGIAKGLEKGRKEGRKEGAELNLLNNLQVLMKTMKLSATEAMAALEVPEADRPKYEAKLNK
jgi:hypothetical protein